MGGNAMVHTGNTAGARTRAGLRYRVNNHRMFNVMGEGWYVHTRDGVRGPFQSRGEAGEFVDDLSYEVSGSDDEDYSIMDIYAPV